MSHVPAGHGRGLTPEGSARDMAFGTRRERGGAAVSDAFPAGSRFPRRSRVPAGHVWGLTPDVAGGAMAAGDGRAAGAAA